MNPNSSLIVTSVSAPNTVMKMYAEKCSEYGMEFIVIGDLDSPKDFRLEGCRFYSLSEQKKLSLRLAKLLPEKHYARKNLGYLLSRQKDVIIETDDDNIPQENFWFPRQRSREAMTVSEKGWVNVYSCFSKENIWPRGFPLEKIQPLQTLNFKPETLNFPIQQGLADENPDVDALYRLTQKLPVVFNPGPAISLGNNSWCPFNSQNTTWFKESYALLYLPSFCNFRMTDIWRSFIAQRIAWTCGWNILFHDATVRQDRNSHDLMKDFADEIPGYLNNAKICALLEDLDLKDGVDNMSENLVRCYRLMTEENFIDKKEMPLVDAWIMDMN